MKPIAKINRRKKNFSNKHALPSGRIVPYNTGKVLIGSRYVPPKQTPSVEGESMQSVLLGVPTQMTTYVRDALCYVAGVSVFGAVFYLLSKGV